ncbi:HD domain-containing protein [Amnibacterium sp.]|uniref:HD domain-containing protein n=1 Tax=Amnibacterium sp. TaxID=1872496 RepID=UPI003F7C567E
MIADVLGASGVYADPLWRVEVPLTPLEQRLLRAPSVRRLAFISHAGASSIATTQSYSRLEHSLGLLALVAHFTPEDRAARVAALLHDIGHLPFSHTFEGLAGLDHHVLGAAAIRDLAGVLRDGGIDADEVIAIDRGERPSALHDRAGVLRLDHLDSFVRSGRSHGRTVQAPPETLRRLRLERGAVATDATTAQYLVELIAAEARAHLSEINVIANAVLRDLAATVFERADSAARSRLARLTDDRFWTVLLDDPATAADAQRLRDDPLQWCACPASPDAPAGDHVLRHEVRRLYLDPPLVDGEPFRGTLGDLPAAPVRYTVARR